MAFFLLLGGVDANLYIPTKNISSRNDEDDVVAVRPSFATLFTPDQLDVKFITRRKRKEEREKDGRTIGSVLRASASNRFKKMSSSTSESPMLQKSKYIEAIIHNVQDDSSGNKANEDVEEDNSTIVEMITQCSKEVMYIFKKKVI